jgi:hypothetical protein
MTLKLPTGTASRFCEKFHKPFLLSTESKFCNQPAMPHEAHLSSTWKKRSWFIMAFFFGLGLWFLYDGWIGFPRQSEIYYAHQELENSGRISEWPALAKSRNWSLKPPEKAYSQMDITGQFVLGGISLLLGVLAVISYLVNSKRTVRSDAEAVYGPNGTRVPFSAMRSVNKSKWDSKGIAVVSYEENQRRRKLVVDDYKFAGADKILEEIEAHLQRREGLPPDASGEQNAAV